MSARSRRSEPITVPPPSGESDLYSAPTRVGPLPEDVLAAMREPSLPKPHIARTRSGTLPVTRLASPPPLPISVAAPVSSTLRPPPLPEWAIVPPPLPPPISLPLPAIEDPPAVYPERRSNLLPILVVLAMLAALGGFLAAAITSW